MKAIILAAGQGIRLKPHTNDKPKCMVELAGKPLLHYQLKVLRAAGIEKIMIVGGYCAEKLEAPDTELIINSRYSQTNMVSSLFCAEEWMSGNEDLLIAYSDIVYEPKVLTSIIGVDAPVVISVDREWQYLWEARMDDPLSDAETLRIEDENRVVELGRKPCSLNEIQGQYIGLIKVSSKFINGFIRFWRQLNHSLSNHENMYMTSFLQEIIDSNIEVRAAFIDGGWLEVDTTSDLESYEALHRSGKLKKIVNLDL